MNRQRVSTVTLFCMAWLSFEGVQAQDRVTYLPSGTMSPVTITGFVIDYNGQDLVIGLPGQKTQRIPADSIRGIDTHYDPAQHRGIELYQQGQTAEAKREFQQALENEIRVWVDREIIAWLLKCDLREGNLSAAVSAFRTLLQDDPRSRHWAIAPLIWTPTSISDSVKNEARRMLNGRPEEQLLGGSLLLMDVEQGLDARRHLNQLASDTNPIVAALSRCQLWRVDLASQSVNEQTLERWRSQIEHLPRHLRSGPQYLLGRGLIQRGELRLAAAELLWVPFIYSENEATARRALSDAIDCLEQSGLTGNAALLRREYEMRYSFKTATPD